MHSWEGGLGGWEALPAELLESLKCKIASCECGDGGWFLFVFVVGFFYDLLARGDGAEFRLVFYCCFVTDYGM